MKIAISYISFEFECVSGSIWFWLGRWVVWRSLTTSWMVAGTVLRPRPPVPSSAPTTLHLSLTSRMGIVNLLIITVFTTIQGMARTWLYCFDIYRCSYCHSKGIYIMLLCHSAAMPAHCPIHHDSLYIMITTTPI